MRRGAALRLVLLDWPGEWRPVFFVPRFFAPPLFVPRLFAALPFSVLPSYSALMLPLEHMSSHVFPRALT